MARMASLRAPSSIDRSQKTDSGSNRAAGEPRSAIQSVTSQHKKSSPLVSTDNTASSASAPPNHVSGNPRLSRSALESDEVCMTSSTLYPLLRTIWDYSSAQWSHPVTLSEVTAGHRYWLPNGSLADEWVYFFQLAPDRFLEAAPESVRVAFETQIRDNLLVGPSFEDAIQEQEIEREESEAKATFRKKVGGSLDLHQLNISPRNHDNKTPSEHSSEQTPRHSKKAHLAVVQETSSIIPQAFSRKRRRDIKVFAGDHSGDESDVSSHERSPKRTRTATVNRRNRSSLRRNSHQTTSDKASGPARAATRPLVHSQAAFSTTIQPAPPNQSASVIASAVATPVISSIFPLRSDPTATVAFIADPAAPPIAEQLLKSHGVHPPMKLPGAVLPTGSQSRAWSAQRIRAWVEIENKPLSRLSSTAFSPHGNEMTNFRTPESIDPRCCPFETSIEENFAYFPNTCTINREMCFRASKHWSPMMIARYINYAHDVQTEGIVSRSKIAYQFASMNAFAKRHTGLMPTASLRSNSTASGLKAPNKEPHDYFLFHMGDGVVRPPTGRQAQMLTRVIEHVRNVTGDRNVRLSQAVTYAQTHGIIVPAHEQINFANLDMEDIPSAALMHRALNDYRNKFGGRDP